MTENRPVLGVQAIVFDRRSARTVLLGRRRGGFGDGQWALPGGHLEFGESFEDAIRRELLEEVGIQAERLHVWDWVNTPYETTHYVQVGVQVAKYRGDPTNREPDRCYELRWCSLDSSLPTPLFGPSKPFLEKLLKRTVDVEAPDSEPTLTIYLHCLDLNKRADKYVSYFLIGQPPALFIRFGRRQEEHARQIRHYAAKGFDAALEIMRLDIAKRLRHGYVLYDARGSYGLETVRSIFPEGSVALRSLPSDGLAIVDAGDLSQEAEMKRIELRIRMEINSRHAQLSLFDAMGPDHGFAHDDYHKADRCDNACD